MHGKQSEMTIGKFDDVRENDIGQFLERRVRGNERVSSLVRLRRPGRDVVIDRVAVTPSRKCPSISPRIVSMAMAAEPRGGGGAGSGLQLRGSRNRSQKVSRSLSTCVPRIRSASWIRAAEPTSPGCPCGSQRNRRAPMPTTSITKRSDAHALLTSNSSSSAGNSGRSTFTSFGSISSCRGPSLARSATSSSVRP